MPKTEAHGRRNSLAVYFCRTFIPNHLVDRSPHTVRAYQKAVRKFLRFAQFDVTVGEVTPAMLELFAAWLARDGRGE